MPAFRIAPSLLDSLPQLIFYPPPHFLLPAQESMISP
jgi:hypothetical protein